MVDMTLGAGSLPEELFGVCYRKDCSVVKILRRRALKDLTRGVVSAAPAALVAAADETTRRIGYVAAEEIRDTVIREYARVLSLDLPLTEDMADLLGGRPGWTFEELLYRSKNPVVYALHEAMVALYMEYVDGSDLQRLGILDFSAYAVLELLRRGRMARERAAELLSWVADLADQALMT
jgi:hypothetical protein